MNIDQPFYDLPDVMKALGNCSRMTLYRLIDQGKLVRVKLGGKALITGESLRAFVGTLMTVTPNATPRRTRYIQIQAGTSRDTSH